MRVFVAIDIDDFVRSQIAGVQDELRSGCGPRLSGVKWVDPGLIHLTVKFLGETGDRDVVEVCNVVKRVCENHRPFDINVGGVGTFGKPPRVLWMGIENSVELLELQEEIDAELAKIGFEPEKRRFSGHLTLARIKTPAAARELKPMIAEIGQGKIGTFFADSVNIYKSELTSEGPVYTLVAKAMLRA